MRNRFRGQTGRDEDSEWNGIVHCNDSDYERFMAGNCFQMAQLIFQRFEQADDSANARKQGTGLGLAISNRLVHMMNSDIKLQSEVGVGSTFSFVVRLERVDRVDIVEKRTGAKADLRLPER